MISAQTMPKAYDRTLILEVIDGKKPLSSIGTVDPSLFKEGGNKLHAVMDPETCLWTFKYERGAVPPALKGSFTGFRSLCKYAEQYFAGRNIKIKEIQIEQ